MVRRRGSFQTTFCYIYRGVFTGQNDLKSAQHTTELANPLTNMAYATATSKNGSYDDKKISGGVRILKLDHWWDSSLRTDDGQWQKALLVNP